MTFAGLGLHVIFAIFCAVHAVRTRQPFYWLFVLFAFPLLGSLVYFFAIYLPNSRLNRGAVRAVSVAARAIDPGRAVRDARLLLEDTPTAQNQMRLAAALLENGAAEEAAEQYDACLKGPFASDLEIRFGAARALVECRRYADALVHLQLTRSTNAHFRADEIALLFGRAYAGESRHTEAHSEFEAAVARHGTFEALAEYEIYVLGVGDRARAATLQSTIDKITQRWSRGTRDLNDPVMRKLKAARTLASRNAT